MKRKKMDLYDMEKAGIIYFFATRIKDNKGNKGRAYILDKPLTQEQKNIITGFQNTAISSVN